jgi:hypothetical protein
VTFQVTATIENRCTTGRLTCATRCPAAVGSRSAARVAELVPAAIGAIACAFTVGVTACGDAAEASREVLSASTGMDAALAGLTVADDAMTAPHDSVTSPCQIGRRLGCRMNRMADSW